MAILGSSPLGRYIRNKVLILQCRRCWFDPWAGRYPGGGNGNPLQYFCLNGHRSLADYSPWSHKGSDRTEHTNIRTKTCYFMHFLPRLSKQLLWWEREKLHDKVKHFIVKAEKSCLHYSKYSTAIRFQLGLPEFLSLKEPRSNSLPPASYFNSLIECISRQEYWSGLPFPPPGGRDLSDPGIEPGFSVLPHTWH